MKTDEELPRKTEQGCSHHGNIFRICSECRYENNLEACMKFREENGFIYHKQEVVDMDSLLSNSKTV